MDILSWFTLQTGDKQHLEGNANPVYSTVQGDRIYWVKSDKGYPYDAMPFTAGYVFLWLTETDETWTNPKSYKAFQWPVKMAIRNSKGGYPSTVINTPGNRTNVVTYKDCVPSTPQSLGQVRTQVLGPFTMDHDGDVKSQPTLIVSYQWGGVNGVYGTREQFYLVDKFGLVRWDTASLSNTGDYQINQVVVFNKLVDGGCPTIVNVCSSITPTFMTDATRVNLQPRK